MEVRPMMATPPFANIFIRFREEQFGKVSVPGLEVEHDERTRIYINLDAAFRYIRKLHDDNLKGIPE